MVGILIFRQPSKHFWISFEKFLVPAILIPSNFPGKDPKFRLEQSSQGETGHDVFIQVSEALDVLVAHGFPFIFQNAARLYSMNLILNV